MKRGSRVLWRLKWRLQSTGNDCPFKVMLVVGQVPWEELGECRFYVQKAPARNEHGRSYHFSGQSCRGGGPKQRQDARDSGISKVGHAQQQQRLRDCLPSQTCLYRGPHTCESPPSGVGQCFKATRTMCRPLLCHTVGKLRPGVEQHTP